MINRENVEILKKVLRENADHYSQNVFGSIIVGMTDETDCGTYQCVAGFCYLMKVGPKVFRKAIENTKSFVDSCMKAGADFLGIDKSNCMIFDFVSTWPYDLFIKYDRATTPEQRAEVACEALDRLLPSGEIAGEFWLVKTSEGEKTTRWRLIHYECANTDDEAIEYVGADPEDSTAEYGFFSREYMEGNGSNIPENLRRKGRLR